MIPHDPAYPARFRRALDPSKRDRLRKVAQAIAALEADQWDIGEDRHQTRAFEFLGVVELDDLRHECLILLRELQVAQESDPLHCFAGPSQREERITYSDGPHRGVELFAYCWQSQHMEGAKVYLKFAISPQDSFVFFTCHESNRA